jgi:ribonuclease P/MRP protein subunit POP5
MVRIKERYLLVNILYPDQLSATTKANSGSSNAKVKGSNVPDIVALHQPTSDKLTHGALLREIRAEVASLFGDYGAGAISSLQSQSALSFILMLVLLHRSVLRLFLFGSLPFF